MYISATYKLPDVKQTVKIAVLLLTVINSVSLFKPMFTVMLTV